MVDIIALTEGQNLSDTLCTDAVHSSYVSSLASQYNLVNASTPFAVDVLRLVHCLDDISITSYNY